MSGSGPANRILVGHRADIRGSLCSGGSVLVENIIAKMQKSKKKRNSSWKKAKAGEKAAVFSEFFAYVGSTAYW